MSTQDDKHGQPCVPLVSAGPRPRPGRIDTSSHQHRGWPPRQVYPNPFPTIAVPYSRRQPLPGSSLGPAPQQDLKRTTNNPRDSSEVQWPLKNRPPPLRLRSEVSPSDRQIPIGIAIPSATFDQRRETFRSAASHPHYSTSVHTNSNYATDARTPTIVVTPADEQFERAFNASPIDFRQPTDFRPRSSVYSRTSGHWQLSHQHNDTPPVPTLPPFAIRNTAPRESRRDGRVLSIDTTFEEDAVHSSPRPESSVPTPRRSRGWWNIVMSPFSALSTTSSIFPRSPGLSNQGDEGRSLLAAAGGMGSDTILMGNRSNVHDSKLRSASLMTIPARNWLSSKLRMPKRSATAPGALDRGNTTAVNIYRTPSYGEAASYYDPTQQFSSPELLAMDEGPDDSPIASEPKYWEPLDGGSLGTTRSHTRGTTPSMAKALLLGMPTERSASTVNNTSASGVPKNNLRTRGPNLEDLNHTTEAPAELHDLEYPADDDDLAEDDLPLQAPAPGVAKVRKAPPLYSPPTIQESKSVDTGIHTPSQNREMAEDRTTGKQSGNIRSFDSDDDITRALDEKEDGTEQGLVARPWHRWAVWCLSAVGVLLLIMAVVLLVVFLTAHHPQTPVEAQWLNLTGFPPMPSGATTVVSANPVNVVNGCVTPSSLWSCAASPGTDSSTTNLSNPNFRFLIQFRNGTLSNTTTMEPINSTALSNSSNRAMQSDTLLRRGLLSISLYASSPAPPSTSDQIFLGQTTDHNSPPYNGEQTPFYISLLDPIPLPLTDGSNLWKRDFHFPLPPSSDYPQSHATATTTNTASVFPLPKASSRPGGSSPQAADISHGGLPMLYPFANSQPLRLFNRGQSSEHYGFYTYFDRSLYLSSSPSASNNSQNPLAQNLTANVPLSQATTVCTWSDTRFLVQIWTQKPPVTSLASTPNASSIPAANSTANDLQTPGSFPYAVTITLDRHGGTASEKSVYCVELDEQRKVVEGSGRYVDEDRAFGGSIVDPAVVPSSNNTGLARRSNDGNGIDGGTGGCLCRWQNFS